MDKPNEGTFLENNTDVEFETLPVVLQEQYKFLPGVDAQVAVEGITQIIDYPFLVGGLISIAKFFGVDLPTKGNNIETVLSRWSRKDDSENTFWERKFIYDENKSIILRSKFKPSAKGATEEFKLGVMFDMSIKQIENGIEFTGERLYIKLLGFKLPIPEGLSLGKLKVVQEALNEKTYSLTFEFIHPIFKRTYYFSGIYNLVES